MLLDDILGTDSEYDLRRIGIKSKNRQVVLQQPKSFCAVKEAAQ